MEDYTARSCLLAHLSIKAWDGYIKDPDVSDEVDAKYSVKSKAGNFNKRLLPKHTLSPMTKIKSKLRTAHARLTAPYVFEGVGYLPKTLVFQYREALKPLINAYDAAADNFQAQYPVYKANRAAELGGLYKEEDYPSAEAVRKKFSATIDIFPVPAKEHFAMDELQKSMQEEILFDFGNKQQESHREVTAAVYGRIRDSLTHMHGRLEDPKTIFRDSMVENMTALINVLPSLNIYDDPVLTQAHEKMRDEFLIFDAQDLRVDMPARERVANAALDVLKLLKGDDNGS